jgi:Na+(H+)/acetate symporter ActP
MEQGWDPDVSKFFVRIVNALALTIIWMLSASTIGLYAELAVWGRYPLWATLLYYAALVISFTLLVRYLRANWRKHHKPD